MTLKRVLEDASMATSISELTVGPATLHGFGYVDGSYMCRCITCKESFEGSKRSLRCRSCASIAAIEWNSLTEQEQADRRVGNAALIEKQLNEAKSA